jgi:mRNA-degrading endonuclease RelE of RelBE toxin-antitoxin system
VIEGFPTSVWNIGSIRIDSPERIEHLNVEPLPLFKISELKRKEKELLKLQKSKAKQTSRFVIANPDNSSSEDEDSTFQKQEKVEEEMIRNYKSGYRNFEDFEDQSDWKEAKKAYNELLAFRPSLEPPKHHSFTFEDYFKSDDPLHLGRNFDVVDSNREFSAKMWIYEPLGDPDTDLDVIPFRPDSLYPLFGLLGAGNEHFRSFTDFLQVKAPKGFPVQIEIPIGILPLSAKVKFQNIMRKCEKGDGWFQIPTEDDGYRAGEVVKDSVYE